MANQHGIVFVLICMEGSEVINVQVFNHKRHAVEEKQAIENEETFSHDTHSVEIHERVVK